jgi:hypothetical protein
MEETDHMRSLAASATVAVLLLAAACGSDSDSSGAEGAGDAVQELLTSLEAGSCSDVKEVVLTPDAIDCEQIEDLAGSYGDDGVDLDDITIRPGEVTEGSATVTVDLGTDDPDETWQAEHVDGTWRVIFDSVE